MRQGVRNGLSRKGVRVEHGPDPRFHAHPLVVFSAQKVVEMRRGRGHRDDELNNEEEFAKIAE